MLKKKQTRTDPLREEIDRVLSELAGLSPETVEYGTTIERLESLHKLWISERKPKLFSGDALLGAGTNLFGIGMVLGFEKFNVITSKAFGMLVKPTLKTGPITK